MAEETAELDKTDRVLVSALQQDAQLRLEDLARMVKLVPSSVHDRLRRLERDGVIRRWTIDVNVADFGLDVLAYVGVQASKPCSKLMPFIEPIAAVEECHSVAGSKGLMLKVRVREHARVARAHRAAAADTRSRGHGNVDRAQDAVRPAGHAAGARARAKG